ncbi:MAG: hypothetical protein WKF91_01765, partial [Segetibacter sp.]
MNCLEMIRHVLEGEHLFHKIVDNRGNIGDYVSPWTDRPYTNLQDELDYAKSYREHFLATIKSFSADELTAIEIIRSEKGQRKNLEIIYCELHITKLFIQDNYFHISEYLDLTDRKFGTNRTKREEQ